MTKEDKKNAYLYCKFRDEQFALYDEYAKRNGMMMKTLLVVNVLFYDAFYRKGGMTQKEICQRTFQSKQTVNLIIKNLLAENYVTVTEVPENKRNKIVRMTNAGRPTAKKSSATSPGGGHGHVHVYAGRTKAADRPVPDVYKESDQAGQSGNGGRYKWSFMKRSEKEGQFGSFWIKRLILK